MCGLWKTMLMMVVVLFAVATLVPTVYSISCYKLEKANACTGDYCFKVDCSGIPASGCGKGPQHMAEGMMPGLCRDFGNSYTAGSLKICESNNCNSPGGGGGGTGGGGTGEGGGEDGDGDKGNNAIGQTITHFGLIIFGLIISFVGIRWH